MKTFLFPAMITQSGVRRHVLIKVTAENVHVGSLLIYGKYMGGQVAIDFDHVQEFIDLDKELGI